jgi:uncharacterized membrane protein
MKWDHFIKHALVSFIITTLIVVTIKSFGAHVFMASHLGLLLGLGVGVIKERVIDQYPEFWDYEGDILGCVLASFMM